MFHGCRNRYGITQKITFVVAVTSDSSHRLDNLLLRNNCPNEVYFGRLLSLRIY